MYHGWLKLGVEGGWYVGTICPIAISNFVLIDDDAAVTGVTSIMTCFCQLRAEEVF